MASQLDSTIHPFVYQPQGSSLSGGSGPLHLQPPASGAKELEDRKRELRRAVAEVEERLRVEFEQAYRAQCQTMAEALREFAGQRKEYFHRVENEVVQLALAIARKILRREASIDPLLLTGMVRVALEKMAASAQVRLRVNPDQVHAWREFFSAQPDVQPVPEVFGDADLDTTQCVLETSGGTLDLSLDMQLKEIEQGFLDLISQRPRNF